jgi:hypothetical protein
VLIAVVKHDSVRLIALAVFCAIVAAIALTPNKTLGLSTGEFSTGPRSTTELDGYQAGYDMSQLIAKYDRPSSRVLLWDDLQGLGDAGWVDDVSLIGAYTPPPIPVLTPSELAMLRDPTTTRVLAVSQNVDEVASAVPALAKRGLNPSLQTEGAWTGGHLYYALIKLHTSRW